MNDKPRTWLPIENFVQHRSGGGPNLRYLLARDSIAGLDTLSAPEAYEIGRALARTCHWMDCYMEGDSVHVDRLVPVLERAIAERPAESRFGAEEMAETCERFMRGILLEFGTNLPSKTQHECEEGLTIWKNDVIAFAINGGSRP